MDKDFPSKNDGIKKSMTRREFCRFTGQSLLLSGLLSSSLSVAGCLSRSAGTNTPGREAKYYRKVKGDIVQCTLCPTDCVITVGERGFCQVRENRAGKLETVVYGNPCAVHVDPIEKKPLFHVLPATTAFSIATAGCNFKCKQCQNWQISQVPPEKTENLDYPPEKVVQEALAGGSSTVAYTYSEPAIFYEYMLDTAKLAREKGLLNMMHSNGFINSRPVKELAPYLDAANIDLKAFTPKFYDEICEGELQPVLNTLKELKKASVHVEVTNLIIPSLNDRFSDIRKMARWMAKELGADTPLHFSRFWPEYKLKNLPPTPTETIEQARQIALEEGLDFVYLGNVPGHEGENTYCPNCRKLLIKRLGYEVQENNVEQGKCKFCGRQIPGIWR